MSKYVCPLCGDTEKCKVTPGDTLNCKDYYCATYDRKFRLHTTVIDSQEKEKILYLITEFLLKKKGIEVDGDFQSYAFYFSEKSGDYGVDYVNTYDMLKSFPTKFMDKAIRSLINMSYVLPNYHELFWKKPVWYRAVFDEEDNTSYYSGGIYDLLVELGYFKFSSNGYYSISAEGWKKIDEIKRTDNSAKQGFIAMSFRDETNPIREAFRQAIIDVGYAVSIIDEKEHNNQIVPEIFHEIERSKFVVVDVTYPNFGAYYEAGYAQALGKQVIICCREEEFNSNNSRPHFDISQKSMVVWKDEDDLIDRLKRRIEATVK